MRDAKPPPPPDLSSDLRAKAHYLVDLALGAHAVGSTELVPALMEAAFILRHGRELEGHALPHDRIVEWDAYKRSGSGS